MDKNCFEKITLAKGEVNLYDFGGMKLHAYRTNDFLADEVFVVEKEGQAVVIESPCFFDNDRDISPVRGLRSRDCCWPITWRAAVSFPA